MDSTFLWGEPGPGRYGPRAHHPGSKDQETAATAVRMTSVTAWGCEIMIAWDPSTSVIVAPARLAMKRTRSLPMVLSPVDTTAQEGREKPKVPVTTYLASLFRYGLLGLTVYVIFILLHVPLGSMIVGFCALAAAAIVASVWEILSPAG